ncbi:unnamed protein product [Oppiella nova]|uniref:Uncharacterized protein n=1 Tax=Oppiella nova TaxID=334625 RepID=A0A7R9LA06_9ACAR|nr:unnamed protein product [Oppiella nova]CAG2158346.1 unnamed protein product [Oppiella nova]
MGTTDSKLNYRKAIVELTTRSQPIDTKDDHFWDQFWCENVTNIQDVFALIPAPEIRALREESPSNLATFCYKAVEKLVKSTDSLCNTTAQQQMVLNSVRLLTRVLPYIFEDPDWKGFFWSSLPSASVATHGDHQEVRQENLPLAQSLLLAICDLLFCPDFTVSPLPSKGSKFGAPDSPPEDLQSIDSCEYIWENGVGFTNPITTSSMYDKNRSELLRLLLTCFSTSMYMTANEAGHTPNRWIQYFTCVENRHALPLFTSLLNTVFSYDPTGYLPFNHLLFNDSKEAVVEMALQILIVTLDHDFSADNAHNFGNAAEDLLQDNLFINYLSRIHREEDFAFILKGFTRLLNNPLIQTYIPNSTKKIQFHQELLVLFWKVCDYNKKFMFYVLKSSDVLDVLVPILYHLNDSRADQSRVGLIHIGVFILLLLSGERNFGVRLNKPYSASVPMDLPIFSGSHADLLIIVFHKIITTGHQRLQPLFDCLLTIIVNVSPYLKTLSMVSSTKLLHLLEAFSTQWFLFSNQTNHHLVFFLLEIFNNIIQYQFDGNSNLIYTIIRKRNIFHSLANLPTDFSTVQKSLNKKTTLTRKPKSLFMSSGASTSSLSSPTSPTTTSPPTSPLEKQEMIATTTGEQNENSLNVSLAATPRIDKMTEKTHPNPKSTIDEDTPSASSEPNSSQTVLSRQSSESSSTSMRTTQWTPSTEWINSWKQKLPLQTIMRMLQVLVPQVEKMCIDKGITDENEILKFLQHGTLVGLLPVPHPILIRKYQTNAGTTLWFRTYMWGVIYLRNIEPPIWYDTNVKLFEIQKL